MLGAGGTAADAAIAAQAILCVVMPNNCGLGGDMLALVHRPGSEPWGLNGAGAAPARLERVTDDGAHSITVPGLVDGWCVLSQREGRLPLSRVLGPAIELARSGIDVSAALAHTLGAQRERLKLGGASGWSLFDQPAGAVVRQAELAVTLGSIAATGRSALYDGRGARAIANAVQTLGGTLSVTDLASHSTVVAKPIRSNWNQVRLDTQPPMSQGVLLNIAVEGLLRLGDFPAALDDHVAIELTQAAFAFRSDVALGSALLEHELVIDLHKASNRGGPRPYLHTAGVATADDEGRVISSLVSVFDDFGSCVFVPELGITLNNRAGGFTAGANAAAPGKRPVHTLAPILVTTEQGVLALATPGADGQVQTLLQVLVGTCREALELGEAIARPRWRSEGGALLIEQNHPGIEGLAALGHRVRPLPAGDTRFGAVVCAGYLEGQPMAAADWRRETAAGVV
jgi:gamma-glutamyltranspeptidase / glutathione hydrolase